MTFFDVVVVGAGQAGLAMSHALTLRGVDHLVLERGEIGGAWRTSRWDSLKLLTPNWANGLPGVPYCGPDPDGFMPVAKFADTLAYYAASMSAPVRTHTRVERVHKTEDGFAIRTSDGEIRCRALVLATGACARPQVPSVALDVPASVQHTTPSRYRRPTDLPPGEVLVVGASASGVQLAREIQGSGRPVTLSVGAHTRLPRTYRGRDIEWWLEETGMMDVGLEEIDDLERARRTPSPQLIGGTHPVDLNALQAVGIEIVGRLAGIRCDKAQFSGGLAQVCASADLKMGRFLTAVDELACIQDGEPLAPADRPEPTCLPASPTLEKHLGGGGIRSIVWATGYRPDFSYLDLPVFDRRRHLIHRGGVCCVPGLYVLGLPFLRRRRSPQISGVGPDSEAVSQHLANFLSGQKDIAA